ncbi:MAG: hypothetical protein ACOVNU_09895 [Candidatus Kapaibacteriota bacterium]
MAINLFTQYYLDRNMIRHHELFYCLTKNTANNFKKVIVLVENDIVKELVEKYFPICKSINIGKRASFNDFFAIMGNDEYANDINIMSNSDIFFDDLDIIKGYLANSPKNTCLALSRYDYHSETNIVPFLRADSQDTWIFNGNPKIHTELEYGMGFGGCDNRLAHDIQSHGYNVINPSHTIKTYHLHNSNVRNYLNEKNEPIERIPQPYLLVNPI